MTRCMECAAAAHNPWSPVYMAGCRGCLARMVSHAPELRRDSLLESEPDAEQRLLILDEARAEWRRRNSYGLPK